MRGEPFREIRRCLTKACENAGIVYGRFKKGGFVFHDLRHTLPLQLVRNYRLV